MEPLDAPVPYRESMSRTALPKARVRGKFLCAGNLPLRLNGVTYGTFRPRNGDGEFPPSTVVDRDFGAMADAGVNAVRTYTVPPRRVLDLAHAHGLRVTAGLPWEQHIAFLDDRGRADSIEAGVRAGVRSCAGHPALLCFAVGNEIPAQVVRWHGRRRVERFLERLCAAVRDEAPDALVTYVNYPSTEYLHLPFLDVASFNVFLEADADFEAYVARLQNLAGDRPLVLTEIGLDSRRNGEEKQAQLLGRQLEVAGRLGCAGTFVFSWTDEWHRGGYDVLDWDFGVVDRDRRPKAALGALRRAHGARGGELPSASVVVCTYNGERWLRGCLESLRALDYPDYEVIVVNDGSTDRTEEIAREFPEVRLVTTPNGGLSAARNQGLAAARGEVLAYVDDDARPERSWLTLLVRTLLAGEHDGVGGPNIAPPDDGLVADCVANAPGGPVHVLATDREAEHVPGCNIAFRRDALAAIGGFDPAFRVAGDDVDVCWRLQEGGGTLGFSYGAMVWHHRRGSVRAYLRQQFQYGKAEALLERKWPARYNRAGHLTWAGQIYGNALSTALDWRRPRIRYGTWGSGLFQTAERRPAGLVASLPLMPEWHLLLGALAALAALGALWAPMLLALPLLAAAAGATLVEAVVAARHATFAAPSPSRASRIGRRALTTALHVLQPVARLAGRVVHGLTFWRRRCPRSLALPLRRTARVWSEHWRSPEDRLAELERRLQGACPSVGRGGEYDRWDLQMRGGMLGVARLRAVVEEHGGGRQLTRLRWWPVPSRGAAAGFALLAPIAALALADGALAAGAILAALALALPVWALHDCAAAVGTLQRVVRGSAVTAADGTIVETGAEPEPRHDRDERRHGSPRVAPTPEPERVA